MAENPQDRDRQIAWEAVGSGERIVLSERDTMRVLELLEKPSRPAPALLEAARPRGARTS
jgi:uncharacterized protein (DUF1778 family)